MRNQSWLQDGTLVKDNEFYLDGDVLWMRDHIKGTTRKANSDEIAVFDAHHTPRRDTLREIDDLKARVKSLEDKKGM